MVYQHVLIFSPNPVKMGRKVNYDEKEKKGPGRKAKKQGDPVIPSKLKGNVEN